MRCARGFSVSVTTLRRRIVSLFKIKVLLISTLISFRRRSAEIGRSWLNLGMSEDERIQSRASEVLNHRILRNGTLLNRLLAFVLYTLRAPHSPPVLRDSAAMAFSKFMLIR